MRRRRSRCDSSAYARMVASGVRSSWLGIRDERPHLRLGGLAHDERIRDVAEQAVQRRADLADLAAGLDVLLAHPHRLRDLAAVERELGDGGCGGRDMLQRTQRAPHAHRGGGAREEQAGEGDDPDHEGELVDRVLEARRAEGR